MKAREFESQVHQCSACGHTSCYKTNIAQHQRVKCPTARVLSEKWSLKMIKSAMDNVAASQSITGNDNSSVHVGSNVGGSVYNNCNNTTTTNHFYPFPHRKTPVVFSGSRQEYNSLWKLFKSEDTLNALWALNDHEIPARVFELWKGPDSPEELKNIRVQGNGVYELRGPGNAVWVSRAKFVKKMVADILGTMDVVPTEYTPSPDKWEDILSRLQETRYEIGKRRAAAPEIARMHHNGAPELRSLRASGTEFLRLAKHMLERALDDPGNEFDRRFPG